FNDLASKKVNYVAAESSAGAYFAILCNVKSYIVGVIGQTMTYNVGVSASKTNLLIAINKALSTLNNNGIINAIITNWLGENIDLSSLEELAKTGNTIQSATSSSSTTYSSTSSASSNCTTTTSYTGRQC
ncbi:MAG: transporter substrate-binding domain-containing protein, partial [Eggerthellaceae bacterium]|nr:transporter substrate-binding domain-containing protein [Eggerthellaceae bacterium]